MSSFFRRLRREKAPPPKARKKPPVAEEEVEDDALDAETGAEPTPEPEAPLAEPQPTAESGFEVTSVPSPAPSGPATVGAPDLGLPSGPPPPLPEADTEQVPHAPRSRTTSRHCFICGTEQDGPWCPTCRMVWTE